MANGTKSSRTTDAVVEWEALHVRLVQGLETPGARRSFEKMRARAEALLPMTTARELVAFCHDPAADLDVKEGIYRALVELAHERSVLASLATHVIWLGLWPGLEAVFHRRRRTGASRRDLVSDLSNAFVEVVARVNVDRCRRLAATIVRNTERTLRLAAQRSSADLTVRVKNADALAAPAPPASRFDIPAGMPERAQIALLRDWLVEVAGLDADLVLRAVLFGQAGSDLARDLGMRSDLTRKRLERALKKAREWLARKKIDEACHTGPSESAFSRHRP